MNKLILCALIALVASEEFSQSSSFFAEDGDVLEDSEFVNGRQLDIANDGFHNGGSGRRFNSGRFRDNFGSNRRRGNDFGGRSNIGGRDGILGRILGNRGNSFDSFDSFDNRRGGDIFSQGRGFDFDGDSRGFGGFDSGRNGGRRRGSFGGNNGFNNGGGSDFNEHDSQHNSLKKADRDSEFYDAGNEFGLKDALQHQKDEGHRAQENSNYGAEAYDRGQNFKNADEENQVQYSHNKQEHTIDQVNFGSKDRVSESSGDKFDSGRKEIDQHQQEQEGYNNEHVNKLTEEQRREKERAEKNSEHVFEEENQEQSGTQESSDF